MTNPRALFCVSMDDAAGRNDAARRLVLESSVPGAAGGLRAALGVAAAGLVVLSALAPASGEARQRFPITSEQRETAQKYASGVAIGDLAPNAPSSYTIKRGDTLWAIATLFLKSPWRWPELWGMNQAQIRNPHLIYPGQTLVLVRTAGGRAQLVLGTPPGGTPAPLAAASAPAQPALPVERLSPRARDLGAEQEKAIPSIPNNLIEPFLSKPLVVSADELLKYPRIVATPEDRVNLGSGDTAYARGIAPDDKIDTYLIFRPAEPLYDPDDSSHSHPIAYEAHYLGTARAIKRGDISTLKILESHEEIGVGDRLVPIAHQELISYVPRRTAKDIEGRIISVYNGEDSVGPGCVVTLNRGRKDGLEIGSVLAVLHNGATVVDRTAGDERVKLPDETIGDLFVFRLFDGISYALVVSASGPIAVGDRFAPPDIQPTAAEAPSATVGPTSY